MHLIIQDLYERGFLGKGSNAMFISLISNKEGIENIKDFRLVSLLGSSEVHIKSF